MGTATSPSTDSARASGTGAAETHDAARDVAEIALAHAVSDKTEAAYRRGDLFEKRRGLMTDWATFCTGGGHV
jgi:hypothetical protein